MKKRIFLRLVDFEMRKAFLNPWVLIFLVLLLLANGWKIRSTYEAKVSHWNPYRQVCSTYFDRYSGPITPEKVSNLMGEYGPLQEKEETGTLSFIHNPNALTDSEFMDALFFRELFYTQMQYNYLYQNSAYRIASQAESLAEMYDSNGNTFEAEKNRIIAQDFTGRRIPQFYDTRWCEVLLNYDYSALMVLLMCLFGLCGIFVTERETEMDMLLRTTLRGGSATTAAKQIAALLYTGVMCLLFFGEDFAVLRLLGGQGEILSCPVYTLRQLGTTPLSGTVGQFFLCNVAAKSLGTLCFAEVILLVSSMAGNILGAFTASLGLLLGASALQSTSGMTAAWKWFNPMELIMVRELLCEDRFVNLLGHAVRLSVFVSAGVCVTALLIAAAIGGIRRKRHACL